MIMDKDDLANEEAEELGTKKRKDSKVKGVPKGKKKLSIKSSRKKKRQRKKITKNTDVDSADGRQSQSE